jgi:hypothetical protein
VRDRTKLRYVLLLDDTGKAAGGDMADGGEAGYGMANGESEGCSGSMRGGTVPHGVVASVTLYLMSK